MQNFTNKLTNGIFLPYFNPSEFGQDIALPSLLRYLLSFIAQDISDIRNKIKYDFDLLTKFNEYK